jgi:hypothetical protein
MKTPKVYLETTIFNFFYADDAPEKRDDTLKLFKEIQAGKYLPYTSDYVLREIEKTAEPKRRQMLDLITHYNIFSLPASDEAKNLADIYIAENIIPEKYSADGLHIATATVNDLDFIVSFNFKHIVKRKTITMTEVINLREGYRRIGIFSPTEVIENEE